MSKDYMVYTDEDVLVADGFEYGFTGSTLWKKGKDGTEWRVNVGMSDWGKPLEWYFTDGDVASQQKFGYMERDYYISTFRY